jgi:hypothetical protein
LYFIKLVKQLTAKMEHQDWITVTINRRRSKKEAIANGQSTIQHRDPEHNERIRLAKLADADEPGPKKRLNSESIQILIRKRIEMKLTQEKADIKCAFPRNTFRSIEANRTLPTEEQKRRIQLTFGVSLKIDTLDA